MEQSLLREYEYKCIQEEPAFCQAACPLHVDARGICMSLGEGKTDEALKTLLRVLPLPRLLTRLCEEPCKGACKRSDRGGSLEMRVLERFCIERSTFPRPPLVPPGGKKIASVGSGISSLTAAWDLCRKGHAVTVFHGAVLGDILAERVPEDLKAEIELLEKMKVRFEPLENISSIRELAERFDAVYAGADDPSVSGLLSGEREDIGREISFATDVPHVFAGGFADTFIERASQGRRAALSIVRDLQGASLTANRDREGVFATRLHTNTEGITNLAPVPDDPECEARRCINCQCLECVRVCEYLRAYGAYPRRYAREIYNNLSVVQGSRTANRMIDSCTGCGLCASVCPNGFDMGALCAEARREMTRQGKMPPSAHEFALLDMEHAESLRSALLYRGPETTASATPGDGRPVRRLFYPGCQLTASDPGLVKRVYAFLREHFAADGGIGLWLGCCGAPARWAGRERLFADTMERLKGRWQECGEPELIAACSACLQTFRREAPNLKVTPIWEVLKNVAFPASDSTRKAAFFEPCTLRDDPVLADVIRGLAVSPGTQIEEAADGGTPCCGYGGLQHCANPDLADATTRRIAEGVDADFIVACAMCRDRFASVGKRAAHLLDFLFPAQDGDDPAGRPAPRWSERRENRERLRAELLRELQGEAPDDKNGENTMISLEMTPDLRAKLNRRRILDEELRAVVRHAETTGRKMLSPEGVSTACLKLGNVTVWTEYVMKDADSVLVRNAWTHRMVVAGSDPEGDPL